ncbi:MAG TPA: MFS transporter [bacterium]|nr:MFS transporter [bacterium]
MREHIRESLRFAYLEGFFGAPIATITSGALLTGFALYLGATPFEISIILALPFVTQIIQLFGPGIIDTFGDRRAVTAYGTFFARLTWFPIALLPILLMYGWDPIPLFLALAALSLIFYNFGLNSWLIWMSDLIPRNLRGRFFGRRNMYVGVVSTLVLLGAGVFLDLFTRHNLEGTGYAVLILAGIVLGYFSFRYQMRVADAPEKTKESVSLRELMQEFRTNKRFSSILLFISVWTLATGIAAPFYYVHLFRFIEWTYSEVTIYAAIATGLPLIVQPFWGKILDRVGHKPLLHLCGTSVTIAPLVWILITPALAHLLWIEAMFSGVLWAGINITVFNIVLYALPGERKAPVVAVFSAVTGFINFIGMLLGGIVVSILGSLSFQVGEWQFVVYHATFFLSFVGRVSSLGLIRKIQEPEAKQVIVVAQMIASGLTKRISLGRQFWVFWTKLNGKNGTKKHGKNGKNAEVEQNNNQRA